MKLLAPFFAILLSTELLSAKPIKVTDISALDFGIGAPGDSSKQVIAGTSETTSNASFEVTGDQNRAFSILLPSTASLKTGNGQNVDTISITNFSSFPSGNSALDNSGERMIFVGATRAALRLSQRSGLYSGSYSITVVY